MSRILKANLSVYANTLLAGRKQSGHRGIEVPSQSLGRILEVYVMDKALYKNNKLETKIEFEWLKALWKLHLQ